MEIQPFAFPIYNLSLETGLLLAFYLLTACYVIFSVIVYYHWVSYAVDAHVRNLSLTIYFSGTIPLLAVMAGAVLWL
jgi:hypothetical protein